MRFRDTIAENLIQFIAAFVITFLIVMSTAFYINTLWELYTTELGNQYNTDTIPVLVQWDIYLKYIVLDVIIAGIISLCVGVFIAALFDSSDF